MNRHRLLTTLIFAGLVAGVAVGWYLHEQIPEGGKFGHGWLEEAGKILIIRPLKMVMIPLVFSSVIVGITSIGDPRKLGVLGAATITYFMATMAAAAMLGAVLVTTVKPGEAYRLEAEQRENEARGASTGTESVAKPEVTAPEASGPKNMGSAWLNIVRQMVPENVLAEAVKPNPLPVICFAIVLGLALVVAGPAAEPMTRIVKSLYEVVMMMVGWILWLAPAGVFCLVTASIGEHGLGVAGAVGKYMAVVVAGLAIHGFIVLPISLLILGKTNPYRFLWNVRECLVTAFGTASSNATIPVTMEAAVTGGGCSRKAAGFIVPLGATVNMDGTALYEAVAVVFLFQAAGIPLGIEELCIVAISATLAAIGAAGIPGAGLVTMVIVIDAVNNVLPAGVQRLEPGGALALILGVDRLLDMCRTMVNVEGDAITSKIMTRLAPDDEPCLS